MTISIDGAREALLLEIARCPNVRLGRCHEGPCSAIVSTQTGAAESEHQVPEPWSGSLSAPILFISSNPSISTPCVNGDVEAYPTVSAGDDELVAFFNGRFGDHGAPVIDGRRHRLAGSEVRYATQPTRFWTSVRARAKDLLGREPVPGVDYALTEVVHCKSTGETGVANASPACIGKYLERVLDLSEAKVLVVLGAHAERAVRDHLRLGAPDRYYAPSGSRTFHVCFLPHPNARGVKKGFDDAVIEAVRSSLMRPNRDDLTAFVAFADAFDADGFVGGTWHASEETEPGVFTFPWWEPAAEVADWEAALYEREIIDPLSDYLSDEWSRRMNDLAADPSPLSGADLATIRTVLTNISRGERFCDGYMADMFEKGIAQAATRRLATLAQ